MAAVKSKSGIYCSSKLEDNAQRMNRSKMSFSTFDLCLVLISMVTFIVDLSTGEEGFEELLALFVSCNKLFLRLFFISRQTPVCLYVAFGLTNKK